MPHNVSTMLPLLEVNLMEFEISRYGFLPDELPVQRLGDPYYDGWEFIMDNLSDLLQTRSLRDAVDDLEVASTSRLSSVGEWRRAYLILSFFTHSYIWEAGGPAERLPPAICVPFLEISTRLELPPTATYAALNLWNFTSLSKGSSLSDIENIKILHTFTNTPDEEWFYMISVAMEARGAEIMPIMVEAIDAVRSDNSQIVTEALIKFRTCVSEIGILLRRMNEQCRPDVFYNQIRPFLAGSKNMEAAGLPKGVFYDEGDGKGEWRQYSGGSNAQSSLIQFLDIFLGVEHSLTGVSKGPKAGFLDEMRNYMPGPHRRFLQHIESIANIRQYVENAAASEVTKAYNLAVKELSNFRDIHIQIVARYIIMPSKHQASNGIPGMNLAVASANGSARSLHGTGGTELLPFLRQSRDETRRTAFD